ncbi:hypothetical protein Cni_G04879 [Canna indica]|uniref:Uncharacterized protein n=1 Tax=Canna indica TaxID=4628 RepID=A0AAQ3Q4W9_9LILI|nr:hypothetical protein Cni_G04879 [Canna indica]
MPRSPLLPPQHLPLIERRPPPHPSPLANLESATMSSSTRTPTSPASSATSSPTSPDFAILSSFATPNSKFSSNVPPPRIPTLSPPLCDDL